MNPAHHPGSDGDPRRRIAVELVDALPEPVVLLDADGTIVHSNPRFASLVDDKSEELAGRAFATLVTEGDTEDLLRRWLATSTAVPGGATLRTSDGDEVRVRADGCWQRELELLLVRVRPRGTAANGFLRLRDEVETRNLRQLRDRLQRSLAELHETNERLSSANEQLDRYAAIVSHDLRAPLALIRASLDLVRASGLSADDRELLDVADRATAQMGQTIDALLALARLVNVEPPDEAVDPTLALGDVLRTLDAELRAVEASVEVGDLPPVLVQQTHLRQAFQNLIANCIRFRSHERPLEIAIASDRRDADRVTITVADNGSGIPPSERQAVFEPMVRGSNTADEEGTGIGLAVVRRICRAYGGDVTIVDRRAPGTTFELLLPAPPDASADATGHGPRG